MITLEEIENISFRKAGFSGYKTEDVDDFVDDVVEKVKDLETEIEKLEIKLKNQDAEMKKLKEKEDSVQEALISAQLSAKQTKTDAEEKSKAIVEEAEQKAKKILSEAQEKADQLNTDTDAKIAELMNQTMKGSSDKIDENNRIIEEQKKNIIKLMGEAAKFRNSLLQAYKEHLSMINSMQKSDDIKKNQQELDEAYPTYDCNRPQEVPQKAAADASTEKADKSEKSDEDVKEYTPASKK